MTKYLQLLGIILAASAVTAEEAKMEVMTEEGKKEETVAVAPEKKAEAMPAAHEHINRKAADALSARLNAMAAPYAGPMAAIPEMPACCASKKPIATHAHKAAAAHKAAVKHEEKKADAHKDAKHVDAKAHEEKKHDDKKENHEEKKEEMTAEKK